MEDVIVIGGGPAGMLAAIGAAENGGRVLLLEKMEALGRKLLITGKGRCNVTTDFDQAQLVEHINHNPRFVYSALARFGTAAVRDFFESRGCPLKVERGGRIFPVSDRSQSILDVLQDALQASGVQVRTGARVLAINELPNEAWQVTTESQSYRGKALVLATGGASYPATGSTGDVYKFAKALSIPVVPPRPALVPLTCAPGWVQAAQGLSLRNVRLTFHDGDKVLYSDFGELMCTHFGLSGPLVLTASGKLVDYWQDHKGAISGTIDLKPALGEKQLDDRLLRMIQENGHKKLANGIKRLLPQKLILPFLAETGLDAEKRLLDLTREERLHMVHLLQDMPVTVTGPRPLREAIVTAGGIAVSQVAPKTMAVRSHKGLYVCGELLDIDADTGGFNLQMAFSTGYVAGTAAMAYAAFSESEAEACK